MVYLVGAGPGDPELITVKGSRLLGEADVVIYDRLVGEGVLDLVRPGAELVFVGKGKSFHSPAQGEINRIIEDKARSVGAGGKVVRLKGGDPYLFGRGGEEARFLKKAGISFEVVPGVTAASGAAASISVPLTDRELSSAVTLVTGHKMEGKGVEDIDWKALASLEHTIVFYMAFTNMEEIAKRLIEGGMSASTPAAAVMWATTKRERSVVATLGDIARRVAEAALAPPVVLIVGKVASQGTPG